ncbi:MAG: hypothetical protein OEM02_06435 [Desulfobulbaceae bacterium]|nr:hypothetical protein [Desulfobulbaceae bacterium]
MDRNETNKKINQISEELNLLVNQNEELIHKLTDGLDDHDDLKVKQVRGILKENGDHLEPALNWLGTGSDPTCLHPDCNGPVCLNAGSDPLCGTEQQRSLDLLEKIRRQSSVQVENAKNLDDQKREVLYNKLQITKEQLEVINLQLSLQE